MMKASGSIKEKFIVLLAHMEEALRESYDKKVLLFYLSREACFRL